MKRLLFFSVVLFTVFFSYTLIANDIGALRKGVSMNLPEKLQTPLGSPLAAGTYTIGTGGYFSTIDSAFKKLSADGIAGAVILELIDNLYTAPTDSFGFYLNGPIPGAGPNNRVTIKPAIDKNITIEGNGMEVLLFNNVSYLTIDGVDLTGTTTLTIHAFYNSTFIWNGCLDFLNNSDHNVVQNIIFLSGDYLRQGGGPGFWTLHGYTATADSNLIQHNFIKQGGISIYVSASEGSGARSTGNIVRNNFIGSPDDSLISWGIQVETSQNTIIENNIVQNIKMLNIFGEKLVLGINSYFGLGDIIRNNVVHSLRSNGGYTAVGILLSGESNRIGSSNMVYNNMVYDIQSTSTQGDSRVAGIQIWNQSNPMIYFNSVYLSGTGDGANPLGSAALYIYGAWGSSTDVDAKNNILVNTRDESPYCASAIYDYTATNLYSDYNDLYYNPSQYNCCVRIQYINYNTLAEWQATGKDLHSATEMPHFGSPYIHLDWFYWTLLDGHGMPIGSITTDFDGEPRNVLTPDIGADEGVVVPVELTSFTASANGAEVNLNWSDPISFGRLGLLFYTK